MSGVRTASWRKGLLFAFAGLMIVLACIYAWLWWLMATASVSTHGNIALDEGNVKVPSAPRMDARQSSLLTDSIIDSWAEKPLLDWQAEGKVNVPRVLLARLARKRDVETINHYIKQAQPRGTVGSTGPFHETGDYDFTLAGLCLLLYTFGDSPELLYPDTVGHIVNVLMTESGGTPVEFTPRLLGLPLRDTENHILMTEGSRYLKNRWLYEHGDTNPEFDNVANGLEEFLLEHLAHMERAGFHEYNSRPYIGYTLTALLNLQSFAAAPVSAAATRVLDRANWEYALGSLQYRRFPPFRRQPRRAVDTDLDGDYHTAMIKTWMSLVEDDAHVSGLTVRSGDHQALWVPFTRYRLPATTAAWLAAKPGDYFVRIGHGADGSGEIYSGGPDYLITAGGVARDRFKQSVARPTTLMLNDGELELSGLLQVTGEGDDYRDWNNSGVYKKFAVGKRLRVPKNWRARVTKGNWSLYQRAGVSIATYADEGIGIFTLLDGDAETTFNRLIEQNADKTLLQTQFHSPDGTSVTYDVNASVDLWVIKSAQANRSFDSWPLLEGQLPD